MSKEYIIYADESEQQGTYYSNFFGGALVLSTDIEDVVRVLQNTKQSENLFQEIKWTKVTDNYLEKYKNVILYNVNNLTFFRFWNFGLSSFLTLDL